MVIITISCGGAGTTLRNQKELEEEEEGEGVVGRLFIIKQCCVQKNHNNK
jgi:hypothetical protein